ncbi:hypothetical protein BTR14_01610 [Rhizobium rhizosphaerae]|uniref:Uncharacterized protein n=1 Tax=Xaviernesmea rhizosphaerae TaxID=1672749 RepID=A0ABX3PJ54_9HYPH|nr:AAA family ATPase [Xaviernesmea rhizosphaerae]OQP88180.1 hypothetical protein BTR14_01610 [Xaviernesmea rhizosphaerae]
MKDLPDGQHIVDFLSSRAEFVGIGKVAAKRLWKHFGDSLHALLDAGEVERLSEVIDYHQALIAVEAWTNQRALTECIVFFDRHGIDRRIARKALSFWGAQAVLMIRDNPFRLLSVCPWRRIDAMASTLGLHPQDPRRLVGAVEEALYNRLDQKHTWCSRDNLVRAVGRLLGGGRHLAETAIEFAVRDDAAIPIDGGYQPAGAAYMERFVEDRIRTHLTDGSTSDLFLDSILASDVERYLSESRNLATLTEEQREAVRMTLANTFSLLVGGAGVGKTTTLRAINEAARSFGMTVHQLAISGKAAHRIAEATGQPAQTIASWLHAVSNNTLKPGRHTFIVIDEASMVDLPTMYRVLFHIPEKAPLLLVGDVGQLPPIGFGKVLHRLVEEEVVPKTELTKVLRAADVTGIPHFSRMVRAGSVPALSAFEAGAPGASFIDANADEIASWLSRVREDLGCDDVQIVAPAYSGPSGIDAINRHFHLLNQSSGAETRGGLAAGDPCLWTQNDHQRQLWNGSLGIVSGFSGDAVIVEFNGRSYRIEASDIAKLELAYCISVHKAQGSQFKNVIVPVVPTRNLDRCMIYTAMTRATEKIVFVGDIDVLRTAVRAGSPSLHRDVGLRLRW